MFSTVYRLWESTWTSDTGSCHITSHSINMSTLSKRFPGWAPYFIMHPHKHMHRQLVLNHWACQDSCLLFPWILPSCGGPVRQVGTGQKATLKKRTQERLQNKTSDCWSLYCLIDWSHDGEGDYVNKCVSGPQGELGLWAWSWNWPHTSLTSSLSRLRVCWKKSWSLYKHLAFLGFQSWLM